MNSVRLERRSLVAQVFARDHGPALIEGDITIDYAELRQRVRGCRADLGLRERSLVLFETGRSIDHVVAYLALLEGGHVPLLVGDRSTEITEVWGPRASVRVCPADGIQIAHHDRFEPVDLHPDLAVLLSTSGSTGSPKLVRLSHENLTSNAEAIAESLALDATDRGITTLPLHYCYGLSVLHAHLAVGASLVLTDVSVVDPCFRRAMEVHEVTNIAGVPHTFDLLERVGPEQIQVPSLRLITQAGGRLAPDSVTAWVERSSGWGVDFFVMYGQTEATARIAFLSPELAARRPEAIGVAIPGGELSIRPSIVGTTALDEGIGELFYRGPNVMLGYAETPSDLALGRTVWELATGDLARFHSDDGVFEIVGRRSRFVKPFGLRVNLDRLERELSVALRGEVAVTGNDDRIVVVAPGFEAAVVSDHLVAVSSIPARMLDIRTDIIIARTAAGKVDYPAIEIEAIGEDPAAGHSSAHHGSAQHGDGDTVAATFASVLGRHVVGLDDTFVSLGGDSLSYVECSIRLERILGHVPTDWHLLAVRTLDRAPRSTGSREWWTTARTDTTVLIRALAICVVVATHMRIAFVPGGAHLLLVVVGFNLSRFLLPIESTRDRVRAGLRTAARAAIPVVGWVAVGMVAFGSYSVGTLLLVNNYVGPPGHRGDLWHFWFIEVFVHVVLLGTLVAAVPAIRRVDHRLPYILPLLVLAALLIPRLEWAYMDSWYNLRFRTHGVAWFAALGWLIHRSDTNTKRVVTSVVAFAVVMDFFDYAPREWFISLSALVLIWMRTLPIPRPLVHPIGVLASATMWIYITHFTIWPRLTDLMDERLAYVGTITAGIAVWALVEQISTLVSRAWFTRQRHSNESMRSIT